MSKANATNRTSGTSGELICYAAYGDTPGDALQLAHQNGELNEWSENDIVMVETPRAANQSRLAAAARRAPGKLLCFELGTVIGAATGWVPTQQYVFFAIRPEQKLEVTR